MKKLKKLPKAMFALLLTVTMAVPFLPKAAAAATGEMVQVGLSKHVGVSSVAIGSKNISVRLSPTGAVDKNLSSESGFTVTNAGGSIVISGNGTQLASYAGVPYIQGDGGLTQVGSVSYRGFIAPTGTGSSMNVINVVDPEEYLYGVVPAEMPALWHNEALKAQAVAARSYMEKQRGSHSKSGYDVCDTTHCQVYAGTTKEHANSTAAVQQTYGQLAYHNGSVIDAVFHSSSGGHTEHSENVWVGEIAYMRGKPEVAENECLEWSRTYTMDQLSGALKSRGANVGTLSSITAAFSESGRAVSLTFNGSSGSKTYEKDAIRSVFSGVDSSLPSTLFSINGYGGVATPVTMTPQVVVAESPAVAVVGADGGTTKNASQLYALSAEGMNITIGSNEFAALGGNGEMIAYGESQGQVKTATTVAQKMDTNAVTINSQTIQLNGRGFGHGVGMSQYGAKGMAETGHNYIQILQHYYTGIDVR